MLVWTFLNSIENQILATDPHGQLPREDPDQGHVPSLGGGLLINLYEPWTDADGNKISDQAHQEEEKQ